MAEINIGEIQKLVCVGGGDVAAIGTKGTYRFNWAVAHSRARVDELGDDRLNALLHYGFDHCAGEDLANALPRGAIIPLPSEKRAKNWIKRGSGPKLHSRWRFESAIEAGFKPRYYLGEHENPYRQGTREHWYWHCESVYLRQLQNLRSHMGGPRSVAAADGTESVPPEVLQLPHLQEWASHVLAYNSWCDGIDKEERCFLEKFPDWQTKILVAAMVEDEFNNGEWWRFEDYLKVAPLV